MKKNKLNKTKLIIISLVLIVLLFIFILIDIFEDKSKIYQKSLNLIREKINELIPIYDNIPTINFKNNLQMNASVNKNSEELINLNINTNDNEKLYQLNIINKSTNEDVYVFIQDNNLYYKSNTLFNNTYSLVFDNEDECTSSICPSNIGSYIVKSINNFNTDNLKIDTNIINEFLNTINSSLDNKYITKKRTFTIINNKKSLYTKYSYKINNETINKIKTSILNNDNLNKYLSNIEGLLPDTFDIDNTLDIYTKFGKIKSLDITLEDKKINMFINNKEIDITYTENNTKKLIKYVSNNLEYENYVDDKLISSLILKNNNEIDLTNYKNDTENHYNIKFSKNTGSDESGTISVEYQNYKYTFSYDINYNSSASKLDVNESKNYKEMSILENDNLNSALTNLGNNEFIRILIDLLQN